MNNRFGLIALIVTCLGMGAGLLYVRKQATEEKRSYSDRVLTLSNNWREASASLEDIKQINHMLENDLAEKKETYQRSFAHLTNQYSQTAADLIQTESSLKSAQETITRRDQRIAELEVRNQSLDQQAMELSMAITNLTVQIAETRRLLRASDGDQSFLQKELKRLLAEKSELETQFNDLTVVRAQVSKLKQELKTVRRRDWIRRGIDPGAETKGAAQLLRRTKPELPGANYDLNVELRSDGGVKILIPTNSAPKP